MTSASMHDIAQHFQRGDMANVVLGCERMIAANPEDARAWMLLGAARHRLGALPEALEAFDKVIAVQGSTVNTLCAKASVLVDMGQLIEAEEFLANSAKSMPEEPLILANLANVTELSGDHARALDLYSRALSIKADLFPALLNVGVLLLRQGRILEALDNNRRLVGFHPGSIDAQINLAETMLANFLYEESITLCDRMISQAPDCAKAHLFRAIGFAASGGWEETRRDFAAALRHDENVLNILGTWFLIVPEKLRGTFDARSLYVYMLYRSAEVCDWSQRDKLVEALEQFVMEGKDTAQEVADPALPFMTFSFPVSGHARLALSTGVARKIGQAVDQCGRFVPRATVRGKTIRLAYVTPDFGRHPTGYLTRRLYGLHDRARFEVFGYALRPDDGSPVREDIEKGCDEFRDLSGQSGSEIVERVRLDGIDIAVDLSGYTRLARPDVFARRVAPVQVNYLAFPSTLGAGYMDYAIVDGIVCPAGSEACWREQLARMPDTYMIADNRAAIAPPSCQRTDVGLPAEGFVFCCFNGSYKIDPATFEIWMRLLNRVEGAILWLLGEGDAVRQNLWREACKHGVDPRRLVFAPFIPAHEEHLGRYRFADLFLDTRYCNAHTTAVDALWAGLPVLTVPGDAMPSRVGASLLSAVGMHELICRDFSAYEEKALHFASQPRELAALKQKLAGNLGKTQLFDTESRVRQLERAFEEMWRRHEAGLPPQSFNVVARPSAPAWRSPWH